MTQYEAICWLDPGKTTGWAVYGFDRSFLSGQTDFHLTGSMIRDNAFQLGSRFAVGCEDYIVTPTGSIRGTAKYSLKTIGMVEWICYEHGSVYLGTVPSSSRNLGRSGGKLQKLGWHKPGKPHANDASAHLLSYLIANDLLPQEDMLRFFQE